MARPTGRYFASVIAKIRDAKRKEQIVIDEGFKMQFRQKLMTKIAAQVQPESVSWLDKLAPFKSYLGVVPALALVIVAVVGISKLPIQFKSNVVIPTSDSSQEKNVDVPVQNTDASITGQPVVNPQTGLKTFPGRLVLPPTYFGAKEGSANLLQSEYVQPFETNASPQKVEVPQSSYAKTALQPSPADNPPEQTFVPAATSVPQQILQYFAFQPQQEVPFIGQGSVSPSPVLTNATSVGAPASTMLPSVSGSTPVASSSSDSSKPSVSGSATTTVSGAAGTVSSGTTDSKAAVEKEVVAVTRSVTATPVYSPSYARKVRNPETEPVLHVNDIAVLPANNMDLNVYYNGNFSNDERTVFEKSLIPHLIDEKDVDYVIVHQKDAATIVIELKFRNGSSSSFDYKVDDAGYWKLMKSVRD